MGEEVIVYPPIEQYISQYTGPEFEEGIMRVLYANLDSFAWLWLEGSIIKYSDIEDYEYSVLETYTHDEIMRLSGSIVDLDTVRIPGSYVISSFINYIPGYETYTPINIFVENIDDVLYMITMIGPDIWYRVCINETDEWTEWILQSFCTIHRSVDCPTDMSEYDLWLKLPNGERPNYSLLGYYNNEWIEIGGSRYLASSIYDPDGVQRNIFEYLRIKMRSKLEVLTDHNAPVITSLYNSECYSKVAYMFYINDFYYFFINPKDIKIDSGLSRNKFYVIRYSKDLSTISQFDGLPFNIINARVSRYNRIYILNEYGDIYHSDDGISWHDFPISYTTNEYLSKYRYLDLKDKTNAEVESVKSSDYYYGTVEHLDSIPPGFIFIFTKNDDFLTEQEDLIYRSFKRNGIPSEFLVKDMIQWHDKLLAFGYYEDGTVSNSLYVSSDEGETWKMQVLPSYRHWSHFYLYDDILIISTDEMSDTLPQTYYAKFDSDIENIVWNVYEVDIGSSNVVNTNDVPIRLVKNENGVYQVEYVTKNSITTIKTIYRFLHRYMHMELNIYTHDEIKELQRELNDVFHTITLEKYGDTVIDGSLSDLNNDKFGFLFMNEDGTLGFQSLHFISYGEDFEYHIHDDERHMTQEERDIIMNFVSGDKADEMLGEYKDSIDEYADNQTERLDFAERFDNVRDIVNRYVAHATDSTIHVTPDQKKDYDSKAENTHTHNLDGRIKLDARDVIGMLSPSSLPKESKRRMIKVKSIDDMYLLDRDKDFVYNGFCIHVLSDDESIDDNLPLHGRFFWVLDDSNLSSPDSYIEFTVTNDDILVYWDEISNVPDDKNSFNITDSPSLGEFHEESVEHNKLDYGFDSLLFDSIERKIENLKLINSASDFLSENKIQNIPERMERDMATLMNHIKNCIEKMNPLPTNVVPFPTFNTKDYVSIVDIQHSIKTNRYYVYMVTDDLRGLPITYVARYTDSWSPDGICSTKDTPSEYGGIIVHPLSSDKELWLMGPQFNEAYIYDLNEKIKYLQLPEECVNLSRNTVVEIPKDINGYTVFFIVNKEHRLGILKMENVGNYEYRFFTSPITNVEVVTSLHYDTEDDMLYVIGENGNDSVVLCYSGMNMLVQSFKYFDVVDRYIESSNISPEISFSEITPEKTFISFTPTDWNIKDYLGKWEGKYIMIIHNATQGTFISVSDKFNVLNPKCSLNCADGSVDPYYIPIINKPDIFPYNGKTYITYNIKSLPFAKLISPFRLSDITTDYDIEGYPYIVLNSRYYYRNGSLIETDYLRQFGENTKCYCISDDLEINTNFNIPGGIIGSRFCNGLMYGYGAFKRLIRFSPDSLISSESEEMVSILSNEPRVSQSNGNIISFGNGCSIFATSMMNLENGEVVSFGGSEISIIKSPYMIDKFVCINTKARFHVTIQIGRIANSYKGVLCASVNLLDGETFLPGFTGLKYIEPYVIHDLPDEVFDNDPDKISVCGVILNSEPVFFIGILKNERHLLLYQTAFIRETGRFIITQEMNYRLNSICSSITTFANNSGFLCYSVSATGFSTYFKINSDGIIETQLIENTVSVTDSDTGENEIYYTFGKKSQEDFLVNNIGGNKYAFTKRHNDETNGIVFSCTPDNKLTEFIRNEFAGYKNLNYRKCVIVDRDFGFFVINIILSEHKIGFASDINDGEYGTLAIPYKEVFDDIGVINTGTRYSYLLIFSRQKINYMIRDDMDRESFEILCNHPMVRYMPVTTDTVLDTYKSNVASLQSSFSIYMQVMEVINTINDII